MLDRAISVSDVLRATACATPQRDAVVDEAGSLTYREFDTTVDRLAAGLQRLGVGAGDRVAYLLWNQRELLLSYFSIARLGALTVSLNFRLTAEELAYQITAAKCKALIVDEELAGLASQAIANSGLQMQLIVCGKCGQPDQLRFDDLLGGSTEDIPSFPIVSSDADSGIWFTSGTTGRPKGAVVKHRSALAAAMLGAWCIRISEPIRVLGVAPLFHRGAMENVALPVVMCGGTQFLFKKLSASQTLEYLEKLEINTAFIVPTMAWQLLREITTETKPLPHLVNWLSASAPLPPALAEQITKRFELPNGVINTYGITEMLFVSTCPPPMLSRKPGSAGLPAPATQIAIYDDKRGVLPRGEIGEILISGPTAFSHYLDNEQATREAIINLNGREWYRSGDVGVLDEDGYLAIKDRKKDMIISGGENVYCAEVELALIDHPSIREVAVIGVTDEKWGEIVVAAIVKATDAPVDLNDIVRSCASLASYKRPREVVCLDALPRNSFGKVRKDLVREMVRERLASSTHIRRAS